MKKRTGSRGKKYKITVKQKLGPYSDQKAASKMRVYLNKKHPKFSFSKIAKSRDGYWFTGTIIFVRVFDESAAEVKRSLTNLSKKNSIAATFSVQPV